MIVFDAVLDKVEQNQFEFRPISFEGHLVAVEVPEDVHIDESVFNLHLEWLDDVLDMALWLTRL